MNDDQTLIAETHPYPVYRGETYYGLPAIKPSHYGWMIAAYFYIGGMASAAQFIATITDLFGSLEDRLITRIGRYLALAGALISPGLLIADLHAPRQWYNMLRIFRRTSPMSIGSWALTTFGIMSGFTAVGQFIEDLTGARIARWFSRVCQIPAALAAGFVALYTGTLLAGTNPPLWASSYPFLSSLFASSAVSSASAALLLATEAKGKRRSSEKLEILALFAGLAELVFGLLATGNWRARRTDAPLQKGVLKVSYSVGVFGLGILAPLGVHLFQVVTGRRTRQRALFAAISTLMGGFILRAVMIFAGNESARRPRDYFRDTQARRRR